MTVTAVQTQERGRVSGTPVREFLLIPFGHVEVHNAAAGGDFTFTRTHAGQAMAWFRTLGRRLVIDYEHQTLAEHNRRVDGLSPAAGWIGGFENRPDGLWATRVEWTDKARRLIASGEYAYFSPVIYWTDEQYSGVKSLGPVALTNEPAMRGVPALAASRRQHSERIGVRMHVTVCAARPVRMNRAAGAGETNETNETVALIKGFFDYAFKGTPPVKTFLGDSGPGGQAWIEDADAILSAAPPGAMAKASELLELLEEIAEHRNLLDSTEERAALAASRARNGGNLRAEFGDAETRAAFMRANRAGLVNIFAKQATAPHRTSAASRARGGGDSESEWRRIYNGGPPLRAEFGDRETFVAFKRAERAGTVRILGRR